MTRQDDELVRRYHEASELEGARPSAHVRDAVLAHAKMTATAPQCAAGATSTADTRNAANQPRWKISAVATVAVVGLVGLLMLQFERGTPEERNTAFSHRRAEAPATATPQTSSSPSPSATPTTKPLPESPSATSPVLQSEPERARNAATPSAKTVPPKPPAPTPDVADARALPAPPAAGTLAEVPAPAPTAARPATPSAERRERLDAPGQLSSLEAETGSKAVAAAGAPAVRNPLADHVTGDGPTPPSAASNAGSVWDAARAGNTRQLENLVRQGTPVDARNPEGQTPLMLAAMNGRTAAVQRLLALGANPALVDRQGLNAAQWAAQRGHTQLAELLGASR